MEFKQLQRHDVEGPLVRCLQIHRACCTRFGRSAPRRCADAPLIAGFQAWEVEMRSSRHQVVTGVFGKMEEIFVYDAAHRVHPAIVLVRVAAPVTVPPRKRVDRTRFEGVTVHVQ